MYSSDTPKFLFDKLLGMAYNNVRLTLHGIKMVENLKTLSSGLEDYIEIIYIAQLSEEKLRASELAKKLNISRASVSEALSKLIERGLVEYKSYGLISLTQLGEELAKNVYKKHSIIKVFFKDVLGIESVEAEENACRIEHIISNNILNSMADFTKFCQNNKEITDKYKKEYLN